MKYVYVICELVNGDPSFRHEFIEAEDDDDAYYVGSNTVRQPDNGSGINDYVIRLPELP